MSFSKLRRNKSQKKSLLKNLVSSLVISEQITTTLPKAQELRRMMDKVINLTKTSNLANHRRALNLFFNQKFSNNQTILRKLVEEISPKYNDRLSGYTRIIKTEFRRGDSAPMAIIRFV
ncbi:50S ribosomal protein L17 ['Crotalaria aegyptiaca' phytoplasma]|uniref:50S ribosomal protein L17 n=1 Tax=Candidatus Phytoplasma crotalariae TaxID=2982627 RepID=A0ABT9D2A1_9MOLU|nr:50S ribosomal protein L17 ['Crotalaria aegyptiaca' phytoplasma]MDO8059139.1 50S ribosomal protein L17 ['Crotalaria aegyptiaca' phytoplasma]